MIKFEVGQKYGWTDWFTGGMMQYTVVSRTDSTVTLKCIDNEADGVHERTEEYEIISDDAGNESILFCEYKGHTGYIYAFQQFTEDEKYSYQLLGRLKSDCEYYLGNGIRSAKYLWAGDEMLHISYMKALYNSFPDDKKPDWLSMEDIERYEAAMVTERDAKDCIVESKSKQYNYSIKHYKGYKLNLPDEMSMLHLLNILEAHGDTLESIHEGYCEYSGIDPDKTDAEFADMYLDCNYFYDSEAAIIKSYMDSFDCDETEARAYFDEAISTKNIRKTTDGYVDINIV